MGNSLQSYLGYGYVLVQGYATPGPPVLNCQHQGGKVYTFRVHDQAKQVVHYGSPIYH
jgi:hypothetical protein